MFHTKLSHDFKRNTAFERLSVFEQLHLANQSRRTERRTERACLAILLLALGAYTLGLALDMWSLPDLGPFTPEAFR